MIDWCTGFPEYIFKTYIGKCCKIHDVTLSFTKFYRCLVQELNHKTFNNEYSILIAGIAQIALWIKSPYIMYKRYTT